MKACCRGRCSKRLTFRPALLLLLWQTVCGSGTNSADGSDAEPIEPFPALFQHAELFTTALDRSRAQPFDQRITGITVPHHLLAVDLIADAFRRLARQRYERIILLSPDHFSRSGSLFATTRRSFQTALGEVPTDQSAVSALLVNPLVSVSNLFSQEHGVHALLPFVARCFPGTPVLSVALGASSRRSDWDKLAATLAPLLTEHTLLIQSTDFSHYLDPVQARLHDQQTLRALASDNPALVAQLNQPANIDSVAAQYIQLKLQREVYGARPTVSADRNSQHYAAAPLLVTTSYIVQFYSPETLALPGAERYFFAGDTFFGRYLRQRLDNPAWRTELVARVRHITGGASLIVNLEGVLLLHCPHHLGAFELGMPLASTLSTLRELNVVAVSLANNHSHDFGTAQYERMRRALKYRGIAVIENKKVADFGEFRLAAATDVENRGDPKTDRLQKGDLASIKLDGSPRPLFALLHFGEEYGREPSPRVLAIAAQLEDQGVSLVLGSHTHTSGQLECGLNNCRAWALGNFVFDQLDPRVSGSLLEVTFFEQDTYFLKLYPLGNLYAAIPISRPASAPGSEDRALPSANSKSP